MKSPASHDVRLGLDGVCDTRCRGAAAALLIAATGCFAAAGGPKDCRAEIPFPATAVEASQISASAAAPAIPASSPVTDTRGMVPLPSNASAELRGLVRDAVAGQPSAEHDLGTFFAVGIEVPQDFERAAYWYRRAADQGVANAAYNLGVLLERGLGVPRDPEAAVARFREAAEAGHAGALNALGLAFRNGAGVPRDPAQALIWFQRASARGNPRGAYNMAGLYESGELGMPDPQTAAGWYQVAAEAGDAQAGAALARLRTIAGTAVPAVSPAGFVNLVPNAGFLALDQTSVPTAGPDPILDSLAAQMAGSPSSSSVGVKAGRPRRLRP